MFSLDVAGTNHRRDYSRRISVLLATMSESNDYDTAEEIEELTTEYKAWCDAWRQAWELNDRDYDGFEAFIDVFGMDTETATDLEDTIKAYESAYIGFQTAVDYAEDYVDSSGMLDETPEPLRFHIDYESLARDMLIGGDVTYHEGHLFHSNW